MCTDIFYNSNYRVCEKVVHYNRYPARRNLCSRLIGGWACLGADVQVQTVTAIKQCGSCTLEAHQEEQEYVDVLGKFVSGDFGDKDDVLRNLGVKFLGHLKDHVDALDEEWEKSMMELGKKLLTLDVHSETVGRKMDATPGARHGIPLSQTHQGRGPGADEAMFHNRAAQSFLKKERAMRLNNEGQKADSAPPAADYQEPPVPYKLCKRNRGWQSERDPLPWYLPSDEGLNEERTLQQLDKAARETVSQSHWVERQEAINRLMIDAVQHNMEETTSGPTKPQDEIMNAVVVDSPEAISDLAFSETEDSGDGGDGTPLPDSPTVPDNAAFRAVGPMPYSSNSGDCIADTTRSALSANQDSPTRPAILAVYEAPSEPDLSKTDINVIVDDLGELENE